MNYYITDYHFEKHDLLIEERSNKKDSGTWTDFPQLFFYENNIVKIAYFLSLSDKEVIISTFYNDLYLNAIDGHKLSVEEISIFLLMLMKETRMDAAEHLNGQEVCRALADMPLPTPETILQYVYDELCVEN